MYVLVSLRKIMKIKVTCSYAPFKHRISSKFQYITETDCQHYYSEIAQQDFMKFCSYEGLTVKMSIFEGNYDLFFSGRYSAFELRHLATITLLK